MFLVEFRMRIPCCAVLGALAMSWSLPAEEPLAYAGPTRQDQPTGPLFERDLKSVFAAKCGGCHGANVQKGGLNLSSMAGIRAGGESGESLVAETLEESLLWTMVNGGGMPPEKSPPLSDSELALIKTWIAAGAPTEQPDNTTARPLHQHDIIPIMLLRCTVCHGRGLQEGGLDLRTPAAMLKGGQSGPAYVAGDAAASLMIQRILSEACPPRDKLLQFFVKRPPSSEVQTLRDWIDAGAPVVEILPDVATTTPDPLVSDADRQHWAFQSPSLPTNGDSIDDFIQAGLNEHGLDFAPEADRDTLIRRAYLDLTGLPPSLEEWRQWHSHTAADWYAQMIDSLLASPRYGERWGRYWLDVAGYADSEGGTSADPVREVAWKYRDYVIQAFNTDKPYNEFLLEQIAGDELIDIDRAETVTEEMVENLVATGFLRMGIDQTGSRTMNFVPERLGVINDAMTVVGSGVLGLTMECARCHTHKYDPIPQRDYYRFKAIFQGALDEHDWLSFKNRSLNVGTPAHRERVAAVNPPLVKELKALEAEVRKRTRELLFDVLKFHYPQQSEEDRQETARALGIADNSRTLPQRLLVEMLQVAELRPDEEQSPAILQARRELAALAEQIDLTRRRMEPSLEIRALWDRGEPSPTYVLLRGEYNRPGRLVGPGVPAVLTDGQTPFEIIPPFPDGTPKTGRRLAFARWLTRPDHPLTARVMVNRIWAKHFGVGLVSTLENFGVQGAPPTHPELLDWLAIQFVQRGWSIKELQRWIMNSRTYRQSSRVTDELLMRDPANRWYSRMPLQRMDAEALRDSLLSVSGRLDNSPGGPPDAVTIDQNGQVSVNPTLTGNWRRSIYSQYRRTEIPTMMETFDYPEMGPNCITRSHTTVSPQSLLLMNNQHVHDLADAFATRVERLTSERPADLATRIDLVSQLAFSRLPNEEERQLGLATLQELQSLWDGDPHAALTTYCHTILNSAAFLYID